MGVSALFLQGPPSLKPDVEEPLKEYKDVISLFLRKLSPMGSRGEQKCKKGRRKPRKEWAEEGTNQAHSPSLVHRTGLGDEFYAPPPSSPLYGSTHNGHENCLFTVCLQCARHCIECYPCTISFGRETASTGSGGTHSANTLLRDYYVPGALLGTMGKWQHQSQVPTLRSYSRVFTWTRSGFQTCLCFSVDD